MVRLLQSYVLHLGAKSCSCFVPEGGLSSRMRDYISSLECVVDHALDNDVQLVLFAGDAH
jgi:exonuclease SbcD